MGSADVFDAGVRKEVFLRERHDRQTLVIGLLVLLLISVFLISLMIGRYFISLREVLLTLKATFFDKVNAPENLVMLQTVLFQVRLPRIGERTDWLGGIGHSASGPDAGGSQL